MPEQYYEIFYNIGREQKIRVYGFYTFQEAEEFVFEHNKEFPLRHYWFQEAE